MRVEMFSLTAGRMIEKVPLVRGFDRKKDREKAKQLAEKYGNKEIVKIAWHCISIARKSLMAVVAYELQ